MILLENTKKAPDSHEAGAFSMAIDLTHHR